MAKLAAIFALLLVAAGSLAFSLRPRHPPLDRDLHTLVGQRLAAETVARLGRRGSAVLIVPVADFDMPLVKAQVRAFERSLPGDFKIVARETIRLEEIGPLDGLLTADRYFQYAAKYKGTGGLVSFVGLGSFSNQDVNRFGPGLPSIYAVSANAPVEKKLFEKGIVAMAIQPRRWTGALTAQAGLPEATNDFERAFMVASGS